MTMRQFPRRYRRNRPRVHLRCPADVHAGDGERIVEFGSSAGGGLIAFRVEDGRLRVEVYRCDDTVDVVAPRKDGES